MSDRGILPTLTDPVRELLLRLAPRYVWWMPAEEAIREPEWLILRIMDFGDYDDLLAVEVAVSEPVMAQILVTSRIGELTPRSWTCFHYRYGVTDTKDNVPPWPTQRFSDEASS